MLLSMDPIFAAEANHLFQYVPIGQLSRALSDHAEPEAVQPVLAAPRLSLDRRKAAPRLVHAARGNGRVGRRGILTVGPLSEATEGLDGQLHPIPHEETP